MKKIIFTIILFAFLFTDALGQDIPIDKIRSEDDKFFGPPVFQYDTYFFMSSSDKAMTRVEIYIGFCNDILQFVKEAATRFHAKYELLIAVFDKKGNHISGKTITKDIIVSTFQETNLRKTTNRFTHLVELVADEYKLIIELTDLDTKKTLHREKKLEVRQFQTDKLGLSDVIFAENIEKDAKLITPNLSRNFNDPESNFWAYFEIYPLSLTDSLTLTYSIIDATNKPIINKKETFIPNDSIFPYTINLKDQITQAGRYILAVEAEQKDMRGKTGGKFSTSWRYFKFTDLNIQQALKPLKNFINAKDWKWLEKEASDSAKEAWFKNYWKQRDPTPDTEENKLMEEFYERVDFANAHFTINNIDKYGWETDRGKIYIKYGPPTNVERHTNELNIPPYEIWYYSSINRRFIFEDRSGFGDYDLVKIE